MQLKDKPIALTGFMGSGKSTVGRVLAQELAYKFIDLDELIVSRCGKSIPEIFASGEAAFRLEEYEALRYVIEHEQGKLVIALGGGCITDERSRELVLNHCLSIFLYASLDCIYKRIGTGNSKRPLMSDAELLYEKRAHIYAQANITIDTEDMSVQDVVSVIVKALKVN